MDKGKWPQLGKLKLIISLEQVVHGERIEFELES